MLSPAAKKDILGAIIVLICLFAITHNPIMYPKPRPEVGNWSIQKLQHKLFFGLAGHNYIVLRDGAGDIVAELHGLATDPTTTTWKYIGTRSTDILRIWEFDGPRYYLAEKTFPGIILAEGTEINMRALWNDGRACTERINALQLSYPPFGFSLTKETDNSNAAAYTLALCMNAHPRALGLFTPGSKNNLLVETAH